MTIAKDAVEEFLHKRELRNYSWIKELKRSELVLELKDRLRELDEPWPFLTTPRLHQLACFLIGMVHPRWMWGLDMGGGKTKITLDLFRFWRRRGKVKRLLALVPKKVHMGSWEGAVEQHSDCSVLLVSPQSIEKKWEMLISSTEDVVVIDYTGLELAVSNRNAATGKYIRSEKKVKQLAKLFDAFALDEIHHNSRHTSLRFAVLRMLTKDAFMVAGMTGTLTGRDPEVMWTQFFLVDKGEALAETLGMFRAAYFEEKKNYFGGRDYKFDRAKAALLREAVAHSCIQYDASEFHDLPPLNQLDPIIFRLPMAQRDAYKEAVKGEVIAGVRIPTDGVFHRMRELCSGFRRIKKNGVAAVEWFEDNPKLDLLTEFIEDVPADRKAVIFFDYTPSGARIMQLLEKMKIGALLLDGTTKDSTKLERTFRDVAKYRFLVANNASGAEGINAQVANYVAYYELPTDPRKWLQGLKRTHRDGQTRRVTVQYMLAKGTIEEKMFRNLHDGKDILALIKSGHGSRSLFDASNL